MFLQLKQAVKEHSMMTRRCKRVRVKDWNKNLLGWMVCNRAINLWRKIWLIQSQKIFSRKVLETVPPSRKTNSFQGAQKLIQSAWQKSETEYASWKKCEELSESSFPKCVLFFLAFWVVVVLLSHVSTQPQTETHYYVKYNMQTQNLKPYNLTIQPMENVNGRCGVRSCFHLLLPEVDAQKKKRKLCLSAIPTPNNFQRAIMRPKLGHWLFYSEAFQSTTSTVSGSQFKEFYWILSVDMDTNPQAPILYLLPSCS